MRLEIIKNIMKFVKDCFVELSTEDVGVVVVVDMWRMA